MTLKLFLLNLPRSIKKFLVISCDLAICALSIWLSFGLRLDQWGLINGSQWLTFFVAIGLSIPLIFYFGQYRAIIRYAGSDSLASMIRGFASYALIYFSVFTLIGVDGVPRSIGVIQPMLFFLGIGLVRHLVRIWLLTGESSKKRLIREINSALIYGAGAAGRQLAAALAVNKEIIVKGFVDDSKSLQGNSINDIKVYDPNSLRGLIVRLNITDVILAIPSISRSRRNEIIANLSNLGVRVRALPGLLDIASGKVRVSDLHELDMNDLLGREVVPPKIELLEKNIRDKVVLVTGAGGSIGSELCRQIIKFSPEVLILIENNEHSMYLISEELKILLNEQAGTNGDTNKTLPIKLVLCLVSIGDSGRLLDIFKSYKPATVFHAAAYKHVPLVEENPLEGLQNNVFGTMICAQIALANNVDNFIMISTDKAVRPTNVMGASKRIAEMIVQAIAKQVSEGGGKTTFSMVRFGNVLGSSGSVVPLFRSQILAGGPITLTHPEVTRYFMTIQEAAQLVIQAGSMAVGGDVFVLNMGESVRIYDLALKMIYLSGLLLKDKQNPNGDIEIKVTGLRPGEKLYEELLIGNNPCETNHPKIMKAHEVFVCWDELEPQLENLKKIINSNQKKLIKPYLETLLSDYRSENMQQISRV